MRTFLRVLLALAIVAVIGLLLFIFIPPQTTEPHEDLAAGWQPEEGAGEYVMRLADCAACHTAEDGVQFAGGRPINSPLGVIYSANITPDDETGIGDYSLDEFRAALYDGVREDGAHLYPAMPYDNYRFLTEEDVRALYLYFTTEVEPVSNPVPEPELGFPFDQRWALRAWKWVGLPEAERDVGGPGRYDDEQLNRGAYIVEGPGHCSACHSPRTQTFTQAGFTAEDPEFLTGGEIDGWTAPGLRGPDSPPQTWSGEELARVLGTGRNAHASVVGEMALVVEDSLQYLTAEDMQAVVAYLRHIGTDGPAPEDDADVPDEAEQVRAVDELVENATAAMLSTADPDMPLGARLYLDNCSACHMVDGRGADEVFPELDGSFLVTAAEPTGLIHMILEGDELPSTEERPMRLRMPGFGWRLSDAEVAELASFVRNAWSNDAGSVTAGMVADLREEHEGDQAAVE